MAEVRLQKLSKSYGGNTVLQDIDLHIRDGEFMVFVGPSGCGKSTLLRMIAGLEEISSGELLIGGKRANDTPPAQRGLAMVFQSYALYPHMTVYDNMAFALSLTTMPKSAIRAAVEQAAGALQITHLLDRKPKDLSGGQRQRVAIGRAIVRKPQLFLFDEPLSNLDASLRGQMRVELRRLHRDLQATMMYVTHDQIEAMTLGQRIAVFNAGKIEQTGTPLALYQSPVNQFVAGFLGTPAMNFLPTIVTAIDASGTVFSVGGHHHIRFPCHYHDLQLSQAVTVGVRAEHLSLSSPDTPSEPALQVVVDMTEHLGDVAMMYATICDTAISLVCKLSAQQTERIGGLTQMPAQTGSRFWLTADVAHCHVFHASGATLVRAVR